ncbi:hypothetical protein LTR36_006146 [Oleoguttula mirabilis]|uniref:Uncharacterized protein n=1 Tax=Oleoguttula mirabilis TaxID=1507867 RepID=A0AAV9JCF3_9PEZI|nr:hypothetical protein LTR36_006146 [Oleoguttula mirabilis]
MFFLQALRGALDAWGAGMLGESAAAMLDAQGMSGLRGSVAGEVPPCEVAKSATDDCGNVGGEKERDRLGFSEQQLRRPLFEPGRQLVSSESTTTSSPSKHAGLHHRWPRARNVGRLPACSFCARDDRATADDEDWCTASDVTRPSLAWSVDGDVAPRLLTGRSTPPPDVAETQYWAKYLEWSVFGRQGLSRSATKQQLCDEGGGEQEEGGEGASGPRCEGEASPPPQPTEGLGIHDSPTEPADAAACNSLNDRVALPTQRVAHGMGSIDPALMRHLREAHARATGRSGYSAETTGSGAWREMTPNARMVALEYGGNGRTCATVAQRLAAEDCDDDDGVIAELDRLDEWFASAPTLRGRLAVDDDDDDDDVLIAELNGLGEDFETATVGCQRLAAGDYDDDHDVGIAVLNKLAEEGVEHTMKRKEGNDAHDDGDPSTAELKELHEDFATAATGGQRLVDEDYDDSDDEVMIAELSRRDGDVDTAPGEAQRLADIDHGHDGSGVVIVALDGLEEDIEPIVKRNEGEDKHHDDDDDDDDWLAGLNKLDPDFEPTKERKDGESDGEFGGE